MTRTLKGRSSTGLSIHKQIYSAISKFHEGTEGQSNEVMLHIYKYNVQLLWA